MRLSPPGSIRGVVALAALSAVACPIGASSQDLLNDAGSFVIRHQDRVLGFENFTFQSTGDTVLVSSTLRHVVPAGEGKVDTLVKIVLLYASKLDFDLRGYQSDERFQGHTYTRGLVLSDTTFTVFHEEDALSGNAFTMVRPPGRLFVMDTQMFVLFDVVCRNLHGKSFDSRPLSLLVMGERDTVIEATATDLGTEAVRWGDKPVQARKLRIADSQSEFLAWVSPDGRMLRLQGPTGSLRVEREAPPTRKASRPRRGS